MILDETLLRGAKTEALVRLAKALGMDVVDAPLSRVGRLNLIQAIASELRSQEPPKWRSGWM